MSLQELLPVLVPLVIVQVALMLFALRDLIRPERQVVGGSKVLWGLIIVLGELVGPLVYFLVGRKEP